MKRPLLSRASRCAQSCSATAGDVVWPSSCRICCECCWLSTPRRSQTAPPKLSKAAMGMAMLAQICFHSSNPNPPAADPARSTTTRMLTRCLGIRSPSSRPLAAKPSTSSRLPHPGIIQPWISVPLRSSISVASRFACISTPEIWNKVSPCLNRVWGTSKRSRNDAAVLPISTMRLRSLSSGTLPSTRSVRE